MSNGKPGIRQEQRSISSRLSGLEQNFTRFLIGANGRIQNHDERLATGEEKLEALIELAGLDEITAVIDRRRVERARAESAQEKGRLEEGVADGYLTTIEKVAERSLVVGRLIDKEGQVIEPGRLQVAVPTIKPEFKSQLLDQAVGVLIDLNNGTKFELLEIYNVDEEKAKAVFEAKQKAAQEAAAAIAKAEAGEPATEEAPAQAAEDQKDGQVEAAVASAAASDEAPAAETAQE